MDLALKEAATLLNCEIDSRLLRTTIPSRKNSNIKQNE